MLKLGLCCGSGTCCALLGAVLWFGGGEAVEQTTETVIKSAGCANPIIASNCSKFSACSVDRNLSLATGDELARYEEEVALDGSTFDDWVAPDFELPTTDGGKVALSDYRGKNVALVFLSSHCYHSLDTLPILDELQTRYEDVEFLPIFINSGDVEDVATRAYELDVDYPLVVSEDKAISELYDSRMVPSTFLIDEQGRVTKKLVGFKDEKTLDEAIADLTRS